jgi:hypothetical protein
MMARTRGEFIKTTPAAAGTTLGVAAATDAPQSRHVALANETGTGAVSIEARTIRKLRIRILPFVFLLFVVALLDRVNIGFAALTMNKELAITGQQYGLIFGIFFFGYFFFEIPSNLLLHRIGARVWIARILISWGMVATLTGFVHTVHQLYIVRFLLGLAEAGYFPGMVLYLTYWFPQREQVGRSRLAEKAAGSRRSFVRESCAQGRRARCFVPFVPGGVAGVAATHRERKPYLVTCPFDPHASTKVSCFQSLRSLRTLQSEQRL